MIENLVQTIEGAVERKIIRKSQLDETALNRPRNIQAKESNI